MTTQIAIAGKGGTGKTTFTALLLRYLMREKKGKALLAVDADANANLNEALGLEVENTIGDILMTIKDPRVIPPGMSKDIYMEFKVQESLIESEALDLLVMGNPQGPGCYCYPNDLLSKYLEKLHANYDYITIDNEAGMEHLSRRIVKNIDYLIVSSDASARGIRSARRIHEIVRSVKLEIKEMFLIISRAAETSDISFLKEEIEKTGLQLAGIVPYDPLVMEYDLKGKPLVELPQESLAVQAVEKIVKTLNL